MNRIRVDLLGRAGLVDECGRHSPLIPQDAAVLALLALEGPLHPQVVEVRRLHKPAC